jgi:uncharacterized membrane protein YozB (DUF420 family)
MAASGLGLILLPWALLLRHSHAAHRAVGRAAAALLMVGLAASLPCALLSAALPVARAGFAAQGLLGLALLAQAVNAISRGRVVPHKRAMLRAASLLSGVVVLRLMVWAAAAWPANFDMAYAVIAWLSWVIPLTAAELWLQRRFPIRAATSVVNRAARIPDKRGRTADLFCEPIAIDHHTTNFGVGFGLDFLNRNFVWPFDDESRYARAVNSVDVESVRIATGGAGERMQEPIFVQFKRVPTLRNPADILMREHDARALRQLPEPSELVRLRLKPKHVTQEAIVGKQPGIMLPVDLIADGCTKDGT